MAKAQQQPQFDTIELIAAIKAAKTEGRLCQKNWQSEMAREQPSDKRLSFLSNQAVRLHRIVVFLEKLVPEGVEVEQDKSIVSPMDFTF